MPNNPNGYKPPTGGFNPHKFPRTPYETLDQEKIEMMRAGVYVPGHTRVSLPPENLAAMERVGNTPPTTREKFRTEAERKVLAHGELGPKGPPNMGPGAEVRALLKKIDEGFDSMARKTSKPPLITITEDALEEGTKRRVTLMQDTRLIHPDLFLEVWLTGPDEDRRGFAAMFARSRCMKAKSLEDADLVVFTGGADVNPALYGEREHPTTDYSNARDNEDMATYLKCFEMGIPMLGVCRGAQFLHVMNGGKLYQHVDNHNGAHSIWDVHNKTRIERVSSVHHQMVMPTAANGFQLLATANESRNRWRNPNVNDVGTKIDVEAFFYRDTLSLGIQGHPEYSGYPRFTQWSLDLINEMFVVNPDTEWNDGHRRLKPDLLVSRDKKAFAKASPTPLDVSGVTVN